MLQKGYSIRKTSFCLNFLSFSLYFNMKIPAFLFYLIYLGAITPIPRVSAQATTSAQTTATARIDPHNITIARDSFGVPHIFAPTDPEVAYGLPWPQPEHTFTTLQLLICLVKPSLHS